MVPASFSQSSLSFATIVKTFPFLTLFVFPPRSLIFPPPLLEAFSWSLLEGQGGLAEIVALHIHYLLFTVPDFYFPEQVLIPMPLRHVDQRILSLINSHIPLPFISFRFRVAVRFSHPICFFFFFFFFFFLTNCQDFSVFFSSTENENCFPPFPSCTLFPSPVSFHGTLMTWSPSPRLGGSPWIYAFLLLDLLFNCPPFLLLQVGN